MRIKSLGSIGTVALLVVTALSFALSGCGSSGGGVSSQVVSGVASVGATLAGQVSLKDASTAPQVKTAVIGSDGTYAIDVTGMKAPYIIQANGTAGGTNYTLHSYAGGTGTANINPLSNVAVASAAGADDPASVYANPDPATLQKIDTNLPTVISTLMSKLQPLLQQYNAQNVNPITTQYLVNHQGLDEMFDHVTISVANGGFSITNTQSGAVIFTCTLSNVANGTFTPGSMPPLPTAPAAPTGVTATGGAGQVTLSWTAMSGMSSYNVYWSTTSGVTTATGTKIANVTSPYVQTGLTAGTTYYYIVTAVNSGGEGAPSTEVSAITNPAPPPVPALPAVPTGVIATGGTNQVTLSWTAVPGATSYNIYYGTASGVTTTNGTKIANATSPAVQTGLAAGTTYYYIVTAVNSAGESAPSVQVAATTLTPAPAPTVPAAPTGVMATGGANQVTVSWSPVTGATSYTIYWSTTSGVTTATGTKIAGATSPYVQTGRAAGTTYYYIVTAVNSVGESAASAQASATTNPPPVVIPAAPTGVTATGGTNQVTLSWTAVSGATSYNIYYSTTSGVTTATGTKIAGATSPYVQTGLAAGTAYYYIVTAVNSAGESAASAQASATTAAAAFDGAAYYAANCAGCHGALPNSNQKGATVAMIQTGIANNSGGMGKFSSLTLAQLQAISAAMQ